MLRAAGFWELEEHRLPHHPMNVCFVARTAVERARPGVGATFWSQPSVPATVRIRRTPSASFALVRYTTLLFAQARATPTVAIEATRRRPGCCP
jgi:hypothetical protein